MEFLYSVTDEDEDGALAILASVTVLASVWALATQ
jgi:hypothetical protein